MRTNMVRDVISIMRLYFHVKSCSIMTSKKNIVTLKRDKIMRYFFIFNATSTKMGSIEVIQFSKAISCPPYVIFISLSSCASC